jgi:hypothetical protein
MKALRPRRSPRFPAAEQQRVEAAAELLPQVIIERRYTRDWAAPIHAEDPDITEGWQSVRVPPSPDPGWKIYDRSKDRRTGWVRVRFVRGAS